MNKQRSVRKKNLVETFEVVEVTTGGVGCQGAGGTKDRTVGKFVVVVVVAGLDIGWQGAGVKGGSRGSRGDGGSSRSSGRMGNRREDNLGNRRSREGRGEGRGRGSGQDGRVNSRSMT
jgi:hypothetical protein